MIEKRPIVSYQLKNPITEEEVDLLISRLINSNEGVDVIIDYGNHTFDSLDTLKYCKTQLLSISKKMMSFRKIAVLTRPPYTNISDLPDKLQYFHSRAVAISWLKTGK